MSKIIRRDTSAILAGTLEKTVDFLNDPSKRTHRGTLCIREPAAPGQLWGYELQISRINLTVE